MSVGYSQMHVDLFAQKHRAFMNRDSVVRGQSVQIRALKAIDAGGVDGVAMGDVHRALASSRLAPQVIRLVVERLEDMGHIYRERIETGGRPRIQMWSFRSVAALPKESMEYRVRMSCMMSNSLKEDDRPDWEFYQRGDLFVDILSRTGGDLNIKDMEVAACQLYAGNPAEMARHLTKSEQKKQVLHYLDTLAYRGLIAKVWNTGETIEVGDGARRNAHRYTQRH
jgi:hypothetical protein